MTGIFIGPINYLGMTPEAMANQIAGWPAPGGYHGPVFPTIFGATKMLRVGNAYSALAEALRTAAGNSDNSMNLLRTLWTGPASDRAKASFGTHAVWLNENAAAATEAALQAYSAVYAYGLAADTVIPAGESAWIAYQAKMAAATGAGAVAAGAAVVGGSEVVYSIYRAAAGLAMNAYDGTMFTVTGALPAPTIAPDISATGGGSDVELPTWGGDSVAVQHVSTSTGGHTTTPGTGNTPTQPTGSNPTGSNPVGGDTTGDTPTSPTGGDPATTGDPAGPQGSEPFPDGTSPDYGNTTPDMSQDRPDFGDPAQGSTTLAGLNGGIGSMVPLGLTTGGVGSMATPASGFRMPGTWQNSGRAFGAGVGGAEPEPMAPRRGVVAPSSQMRRRRDAERQPGKVFVPGEPLDVPVLEQPPAIGVIEYVADDR